MSMGMNTLTGFQISDIEHLRQSISKILTTPIGSRVQRRDFGSLLPDLIDQPLNDYLAIQLYAATATALLMHEPRFALRRVTLETGEAQHGRAQLELEGVAVLDELASPATLTIDL